MSCWEEAPGQTQEKLERLHLSAGLAQESWRGWQGDRGGEGLLRPLLPRWMNGIFQL